jgi:hypothetical protein
LIGVLLLWTGLREAIPALGLVALIPGLFWINIPTGWLGLAHIVGQSNFELTDFGFMPNTLWGWLSVVMFWTLLAIVMTGFTQLFRMVYTERVPEVTPDRDEDSLAQLQESLKP